MSNIGVFPSFVSVRSLSLALPLSLPFDATGPLSVLSSPPSSFCTFSISTFYCGLYLCSGLSINFDVKRTRHRADINPIAIKPAGKRVEVQNEIEGVFGREGR